MEIKTLVKTSKQLELEIFGENETLLNPIVQVLLTYDDIDFASIITEHPLAPSRKLYVRLKTGAKKEPIELLRKAVTKVTSEVVDFRKEFEDAIKKAERKK